MSEPAVFALIRDGKPRFYADRWASVFLHRELMYGPDDFETWVSQLEELDEWEEGSCGGAVADYDHKKLVWRSDSQPRQIPRVAEIYDRLLQAAWPGFDIAFAYEGMHDLAEAVGAELADLYESDEDYSGDYRPDTVAEAARIDDQDEEDEDEEEQQNDEIFDDDEVRAWVTIIEADGAVRHRHLEALPEDLLASAEPVTELKDLPPAEVPAEGIVREGMWIDEGNRTVGIWGSHNLRARIGSLQQGWNDWSVQWAERGYAQQCEVAGPAGVPLSEAEALAKFLPLVLSTKRLDMSAIIGAIGGGLKKTAMKATGCLLVVICMPLVIFGLVSGSWKPVLISIAITCALVIAAFKVIEFRLKRSFTKNLPKASEERQAPPTAGPLDESQRRQRIDKLLAAAGLPGLDAVEPLFPQESELDLLE